MASASFDPERAGPQDKRDGSRGAEIHGATEPLLGAARPCESYSVRAAIIPFLFPALGGLLYGYDIGATSGATISLESSILSGTVWYDLSSVEIGLQVSGSLYGALIGSALAFAVADFLGRRRELMLSSVLYLSGALLTAFAPSFPLLVFGRFIFGIGIGLAMHAAPMYIAETAPSQIRGRLISLKEFFIVLGMLLGYIAGNVYVDMVGGWRYMYASSAPISLIMFVGMWWLPPSPRWLLLCVIQGKGSPDIMREAAICSLCRLRGRPIDSSSTEEIDGILLELSYSDMEKTTTFSEIFQGKCLKALTIGVGLVFFQQVTGQPSVLYYAATILKSAGFSAASDATRVSILLGLLKLIMTGVAVLVVDRLGRRPLLIGGVSGIVISLFMLSSYYSILKDVPLVAVVGLLLYVSCYQVMLASCFILDLNVTTGSLLFPNLTNNLFVSSYPGIYLIKVMPVFSFLEDACAQLISLTQGLWKRIRSWDEPGSIPGWDWISSNFFYSFSSNNSILFQTASFSSSLSSK